MEDERQHEADERVRMAPIMTARDSHPQATSDLGEKEAEEEKKETRGLRWADCNDEEEQENLGEQETEGDKEKEGERKEEVKGEKETGEEKTTGEKPPGLEVTLGRREKESEECEPKVEEDVKSGHVESEHEVKEEEKKRAQEAQEEKRAQEA